MSTAPANSDTNIENHVVPVENAIKNDYQNNNETKDAFESADEGEAQVLMEYEIETVPRSDAIATQHDIPHLSTISNASRSYSITLYLLRHSDPYPDWKIQAIFGRDIKFDFLSMKSIYALEVR